MKYYCEAPGRKKNIARTPFLYFFSFLSAPIILHKCELVFVLFKNFLSILFISTYLGAVA